MSEEKAPGIVTINDKLYQIESITEHGIKLINTVKKIDEIISIKDIEIKTANIARSTVFDQLIAEAANFTEIQKPEIPETEKSEQEAPVTSSDPVLE